MTHALPYARVLVRSSVFGYAVCIRRRAQERIVRPRPHPLNKPPYRKQLYLVGTGSTQWHLVGR